MNIHPSFNPGFGHAVLTADSNLPIAWFVSEVEALEWKHLHRGNRVQLTVIPCNPIQSPSSANAANSTTEGSDILPSSSEPSPSAQTHAEAYLTTASP